MGIAPGVDGRHAVLVLVDPLDARGGHELDVAGRLHALEERRVQVGAMAHRRRGDLGLDWPADAETLIGVQREPSNSAPRVPLVQNFWVSGRQCGYCSYAAGRLS